jgi:phosphoserine phosphatase RsbU/P
MGANEAGEMRILIAEDDDVTRLHLESILRKWGYEVVVTTNGGEAWQVLKTGDAPNLAILDWMMPEMDGVEVCRKARESKVAAATYVLLLTMRDHRDDMVQGLQAGADDYVTKPFDQEELRARLQVGARVAALQKNLTERVHQLEEALANVKQLRGLLPICSYCKKIRNDGNYWQQVEAYIEEHSGAQFSHGICPECYAQYIKPEILKPGIGNKTET